MRVLDAASQSDHSDGELSQIMFEMTKLFFEGIDPGCTESARINSVATPESEDTDRMCPMDTYFSGKRKTDDGVAEQSIGSPSQSMVLNVFHLDDRHNSIRGFVRSLAQEFNNLMMGVLGNITLIGMDCSDDNDVVRQVRHLERLITTAANLTHLLFGYLSERRVPAKKLQLTQLLTAVEDTIQASQDKDLFMGIKHCMCKAPQVQDRFVVAGSMAGLIEQLLEWIQSQLSTMEPARLRRPKTVDRHRLIGHQIDKGFTMVKRLKYYSGQSRTRKKWTSLCKLLHSHVDDLRHREMGLEIASHVPDTVPWIYTDPELLGTALQAITENAVQAMSGSGTLRLVAQMLYDESPAERCAVHSRSDYLVISVSDTGCGMDRNTQSHVFDPFYKAIGKKTCGTGMGLTAASGIVKSLGGYIQFRSTPGHGSMFKIYLPVRHASLFEYPLPDPYMAHDAA